MVAAGGSSAAAGKRYTVTMDGSRFEPETLTVRPGDTVVWMNRDPFPHTVTARSGAFDSGSIATGKSWRYKPKKSGVLPYFCSFHPTMKGTLRVE